MNDEEVLTSAATLISFHAQSIKRCHTVNGQWDASESQARKDYDEMMRLARLLIAITKREQRAAA